MLPLKEEAAWQYVSHLKESQASASKATSFVQACRFCHYVLGVEGALQVVSSRRVCGLADIQLSGKREAKQARPLTVKEGGCTELGPVMVGDPEDGQSARRRSSRNPVDASSSTSIRYHVEHTASHVYRDHCDVAFSPWSF